LAFWLLVLCLSLVITGCDFLVDLTSDSQADRTSTQSQEFGPPLELGSGELPESGSIERTFDWLFSGKEFTWELNLPQSLYDYYSQLPRTLTANYSVYATHPMDDAYLEELVAELETAAQEEGFNPRQTAEFAISFVQSLPYSSDSVATPFDEYARYPIETLVDMGGDCEDSTIVLASLLDMMGYDVVILTFPGTASEEGHCAVGVAGVAVMSVSLAQRGTCLEEIAGSCQSEKATSPWTWVYGGVGIAALAGSVTWLVVSSKRAKEKRNTAWMLTPTGVVVSGSF